MSVISELLGNLWRGLSSQKLTNIAIICFGLAFAVRFSGMQQSLTDLLRQSQTLVDRSAALASDRDMQMRQAVLLLPGLANTRKGNSIYITTTDEGENLLGEQFRQEIDAIYGRLKAAKLPAATVADSVVAGMEENGFVIAAAERKLSVEQLKGLVFAHLGRKMLEESPAAGQK